MDVLQLLNENWNLLWALAMLLTGFVLWHMSQRFVSKKEFESALADFTESRERQDKTLSDLGVTIAQLNAAINTMPNTAALHRLELGLEELRGLQKETAAQLKGQSHALERLNNNFDRLAMKREAS